LRERSFNANQIYNKMSWSIGIITGREITNVLNDNHYSLSIDTVWCINKIAGFIR
jgi:hypothetical protein